MNAARALQGWSEALQDHPFLTAEALLLECENGSARCWSGAHSDVFTRIEAGVLEIGPVAGDLKEMLGMLPRIEAWARLNGATQVHIQAGRDEWEHVLSPLGYSVAAVILRKTL